MLSQTGTPVVTESKYATAYLTWRGHRLTIEPGSGGRLRFVFPKTARHDFEEYENGALVPAAIFGECLSRLNRLIAEKRGAAR